MQAMIARWTLLASTTLLLACRTTEGMSEMKTADRGHQGPVVIQDVAYRADALKEGKQTESAALLSYAIGRWTITGPKGEETQSAPGTYPCRVSAEAIAAQFGEARVKEVKAALASLYARKDKRQVNPIFRPLRASLELLGTHDGRPFIIEKTLQSQDVIQDAPGTDPGGDRALVIETARAFCPKLPPL